MCLTLINVVLMLLGAMEIFDLWSEWAGIAARARNPAASGRTSARRTPSCLYIYIYARVCIYRYMLHLIGGLKHNCYLNI